MATIDDFVNHRWADAKEALRQLDPDYVNTIEWDIRSPKFDLNVPSPADARYTPKKRLPKNWHLLLEVCLDLTMHTLLLETVAAKLTMASNRELPPHEVGRQSEYHFRAWFIQLSALAERNNDVIYKALNVYLPDRISAVEIAKSYRDIVHQFISQQERNEFLHPRRREWLKEITRNGSWELFIAGIVTPQTYFKFHFSVTGEQLLSSPREQFSTLTKAVLERFGETLSKLEQDLMTKYKLKYRMGQRG